MLILFDDNDDNDHDRFYIVLFSALEQTHDDRFYRALFSALKQTHCALVTCESKRVTVAFYSAF